MLCFMSLMVNFWENIKDKRASGKRATSVTGLAKSTSQQCAFLGQNAGRCSESGSDCQNRFNALHSRMFHLTTSMSDRLYSVLF